MDDTSRRWMGWMSRAVATVLLLGILPTAGVAQDSGFRSDTRSHLSRLEKLGFAGVVVVVQDGVPLFAEGFGLADRERRLQWTPATVSTIGSITKQFTAAGILALEEDGRLSVTDPITKYFPDVPADKSAITLHHLLTHSSGILDLEGVGDWDPVSRTEYIRRSLSQPLGFSPGTGYEYSNAGYSLLGAIIEQLTNGSWEEFSRRRLFLPQGMYETGYILPEWGEGRIAQGYRDGKRWGTVLERPMDTDGPYWALRANGGVHLPAWDMIRWAKALLDGRILSSASLEKMWFPHVKEPGDSYYAYGWVVLDFNGTKVVTHNGGNGIFFADLALIPSSRTILFLQSNVIADNPIAHSLLQQIGNRLLGQAPYPNVPDVVEPPPDDLVTYAGTYRADGTQGSLEVLASEGRLLVEARDPKAFTRLHSSRPIDEAKTVRLTTLMDQITAAALSGDFGPMQGARGDGIPAARLAERHGEWASEQEALFGKSKGYEIVGTAFQEGRDVVLVRFLFERGSADRAYVWDPRAEARLLGISGRGLNPRVAFLPTGPGSFASWDGGYSPSQPMTFTKTPDGRLRLTLDEDAKGLSAVR